MDKGSAKSIYVKKELAELIKHNFIIMQNVYETAANYINYILTLVFNGII